MFRASRGPGRAAATSDPMDDQQLKRAMRSPAEAFATPEAIRDHAELTVEQKIELLRRWAYDESELLVAEDEGMMSEPSPSIAGVLRVLDELTGGFDIEHRPPTKQGGF